MIKAKLLNIQPNALGKLIAFSDSFKLKAAKYLIPLIALGGSAVNIILSRDLSFVNSY